VRFFLSRRQEKKMALHPVALAYRRLRINLANAGVSGAPNLTPREFLELVEGRIEQFTQLRNALRMGTEIYERTIYSPLAPEVKDIILFRNSIKKSIFERVGLRLKYVLKRITKK